MGRPSIFFPKKTAATVSSTKTRSPTNASTAPTPRSPSITCAVASKPAATCAPENSTSQCRRGTPYEPANDMPIDMSTMPAANR